MREREVRDLLRGIDEPRRPRPQFAASLRERLLAEPAAGADVIELDDVDPSRRRTARPARWVALVAAALSLVIIGSIAVLNRSDSGPAIRARAPRATVEAACERFSRSAFGTLGRAEFLRVPSAALTTRDPAATIDGLRISLTQLRADLRAVGIREGAVFMPIDIAVRDVVRAREFVESGAPSRSSTYLESVESRLVEVRRALTAEGVPSCL
jgi:hypothetical protein